MNNIFANAAFSNNLFVIVKEKYMNIDDYINSVPQWGNAGSICYEPLSGGYSNHVYKVFVDGETWVLRVNGTQNEILGLDYREEEKVQTLAFYAGIAPEVVNCGEQRKILVTRFVEGNIVSIEQLKQHETIKSVILLLKKVHTLSYSGKRYSTPFSLTRDYLIGAKNLGICWASRLKPFLDKMNRIEKIRERDPGFMKHYCHNDMFNHNMIQGSDGKIKLLDWELSGLGDIWFDLATLSFSCDFDVQTEEFMLMTYFDKSNENLLQTLHSIKFVCMLREIGWALLHTALNKQLPVPDNDYLDFADSVFARLEQGLLSLV
ncbi:MAG: phosphotransferase [Spirochaetes bacterium]|nr:phosphotransferase [Spirochaetota bacterium]MBN2770118.1 phosphotransferase [Spirochaetota bacterium]